MGVSFTVYSQGNNIDRAWPFDLIPRVIPGKAWHKVRLGLMQRSRALNCFIHDVYNEQRILAEGLVPAELVLNSPNFKQACVGVNPPQQTWAHISGVDLVRGDKGRFYVLEDNLRVPSGVAYMLENREVTKRVLPEVFRNHSILPVDNYPTQLYETLTSLVGRRRKPCVVVLTPGVYNSAYFEHAFLAREMGAELVEGADLFVDDDDHTFMRTVDGPRRVDVVYRRIDDEFLDPEAFREDSMLGVPGLMRSWRAGNMSQLPMPRAVASQTTRSSMRLYRIWCVTTCRKNRSWPM